MYIRNLRRLVLQRSKQTKGYLMNIAYVRVSAADQNEDRQRCSLEPYHIERWYIEKASGKDTNRPRLKEMLDFVKDVLRQLADVMIHVIVGIAVRHRDNLLITHAAVQHFHNADGIASNKCHRTDVLRAEHQHVQRVMVIT